MQGNKRPRIVGNGTEELVVGLVFLAVDNVRDKTLSERSIWSSHWDCEDDRWSKVGMDWAKAKTLQV